MLSLLTDAYELKARVLPSVLVALAPLGLFVGNTMFGFDLSAASLGVLLIIAIMVFASSVVRGQGQKHESRLVEVWDGLPTTKVLRHRDSTINSATKARYHDVLGDLDDKIKVPDQAQESKDPKESDTIYSSLIDKLRERTRDSNKYPRVQIENRNYGFARNMRGIKAAGLFVGALVLAINLLQTFAPIPEISRQSLESIADPSAWQIGAWIGFLQLIGFAFFVNDATVRKAGEGYAKALLATLDED